MGRYKVINILGICQKLKILWHFEIFVNTGPHGAGNFQNAIPVFVLILAKLYEDIGHVGWHGGIQAFTSTFLGNQISFNNFMVL